MNRRELLKAAFGGVILSREVAAQAKVERATRGMAAPHIKDISVIATAPQGLRLVVVKITTDQDGL
jgi:mannonate dehydratase